MEHTPARQAEIISAATAAGAVDPADFLKLIPATELVNAADAVAKVKASKPYFFRNVMAMGPTAYASAKRSEAAGAEKRRRADDEAAQIARISKRYSTKG